MWSRIVAALTVEPTSETPKQATNYPHCPMCPDKKADWIPRSRGEAIMKFNVMWIRQFFDCTYCGLRCHLQRRVDSDKWTFSNTYGGW